MKRFKLNNEYYKLIDGFEVNESSREVKYSNVKIDFTGKGISDLPLKYQECQLVDGDFRHIDADDGQRIEGTSFQVNQREEKLNELEYVKGQIEQTTTQTGKNLYNANNTTYYGSCTYVSGANTNQYKVKATGTDVIINSQVSSGSSYSSSAGTLIPCKYGETIYYDTGNSNFSKNFITQYNASKVSLGFANIGHSSGSYTPTNSACEYISIRIGYGSATSGTEYTLAPIISKSSNLSYEPYIPNSPSPDYPQPINITTGRQVVSVIGRNYFDNSKPYTYQTINNYLETTIPTGKRITWTSSTQYTYQFLVYAVMDLTDYVGKTIRFRTDFSASGSNNGSYYIGLCNADGTNRNVQANANGTSGQTLSFVVPTLSGQQTYLCVALYVNLTGTLAQNDYVDFTNIMLTIDDSDTTYEEYKGKDYEINLGKNLLNLTGTNQTVNGVQFTFNEDGTILANGTATAEINKIIVSSLPLNNTLQYTFSGATGGSNTTYMLRATTMGWGDNHFNYNNGDTFTPRDTANYQFMISIRSGITLNNVVFKPQLEKGNVASSFSPYFPFFVLGTLPNTNYKNYIFKNVKESSYYNEDLIEGQWYLHKEIERVVLNGSENNWVESVSDLGWNAFTFSYSVDTILNANACSNYFKCMPSLSDWRQLQNNQAFIGRNKRQMIFRNDSISGLANWKTWLSSHNVEVYYVLNEPIDWLLHPYRVNELESVKLIDGLNNVNVSSPYLPSTIGLHYNYQVEHDIEEEKETIYTGYVNNYTLPKMKNKLEYRELDIDLLSPLAIATLRTADAVGTYNLKDLIREIIQPLIDDGFTLKELNVGNNQISVNYLTETIESSLNKLSNKFNFWWYIDKNKNIYINDINYIFSKGSKAVYDDNNKINGLIDFTPKMESIDYCNTLDFTNVRLFTLSTLTKVLVKDDISLMYEDYYYNPLIIKDTISPGEEITFDTPFVIDTDRRGMSNTQLNIIENYFQLYKIASISGDVIELEEVVKLSYDENNNVIVPSNATISDSFNEDAEFVFVRDSFFDNLIVGFKYNGNSTIQIGDMSSQTGLIWTKIRINDNKEIEINKDIVSKTGIVEKQVDMNEQWFTYEELLDISHSLIRKNDVNVENIEILTDVENDFNVGDIINIDKQSFLTYGNFIITDKKRRYEDNVDSWIFELKNTNILESYIDLFRSSEQEETSDKLFNLMTGDYSEEGIKETYEVVL